MMKAYGDAGGVLVQTLADPIVIIPLTFGGTHGDRTMRYALVDAVDYPLVQGQKWRARWCDKTRSFYAGATVRDASGKRTERQLHRVLLGLEPDDKRHGDHINHATLDNRRVNLRVGSPAQSSYNRKRRRNNTSGFKGVFAERGRWRAMIRCGRLHHLGVFSTREAAAAAYDEAARRLHGEFARTNA